MGPCMYRPCLTWPRLKEISDTLLQHNCSICATMDAHPAVHGACLASLPLLSRFGAGADLACSLCCLPPWGEERDKLLPWLFLGNSHSGNTLPLVVGILEIPIMNAVVFPFFATPLLECVWLRSAAKQSSCHTGWSNFVSSGPLSVMRT